MPGRLWRFSWRDIASLINGSLSKTFTAWDESVWNAHRGSMYLECSSRDDRYRFHCWEFLLRSKTILEQIIDPSRTPTCFFCHSNSLNERSSSCKRFLRAYSLALLCDSRSDDDWPIVWKILSRRRTDSYTRMIRSCSSSSRNCLVASQTFLLCTILVVFGKGQPFFRSDLSFDGPTWIGFVTDVRREFVQLKIFFTNGECRMFILEILRRQD